MSSFKMSERVLASPFLILNLTNSSLKGSPPTTITDSYIAALTSGLSLRSDLK